MLALLNGLVGLYVHHLKDLAPIREIYYSPPEYPRTACPVHPNSSPLCDIKKEPTYRFIGSGFGNINPDLSLAICGNCKRAMQFICFNESLNGDGSGAVERTVET